MARSLRITAVLTLLLALAVGAASNAAAGGRKVLDSTMTGLPTGSLVLNGVTGGGVPWTLDQGRAQLFADGRLHVEVEGLVVAATGVNPVTTGGKAIVTCSNAPVAETAVFPFSSPEGDATIDTVVDLPGQCLAPAVFFTTATGRWLAVTGF
jgi:hypothetical protein